MRAIAAVICLLGIESIGAYLIMHDHATIGGWMCLLTLCGMSINYTEDSE